MNRAIDDYTKDTLVLLFKKKIANRFSVIILSNNITTTQLLYYMYILSLRVSMEHPKMASKMKRVKPAFHKHHQVIAVLMNRQILYREIGF